MRRRCTVSAFLARGVCGAATEESLAGLATLARGLRTFLTVSSAVIEPAEYALGVEKTQICGDDAQGAVATGYREPHTYPMPRSEMCLGLKPRMKVYSERIQTRSGRERVYQAAAGRRAACRKGTFY